MPASSALADARFWLARVNNLLRRGLSSLRARGWRATLQRAVQQFRPPPALPRDALFMPSATPFAPFALPASLAAAAPRASVVIPACDREATLACLRALSAHPPSTDCEVIVVDGGSDATSAWMQEIAGLRHHRRTSGGGSGAACNEGAAQARGELLVFLDGSAIPQPGWLDALLATFERFPAAGLAGAQLLAADGSLLQARGGVSGEGEDGADAHGHLESPDDPRHAYVRDADACSSTALAIPRVLFEQVGGFDVRYASACHADADLACSIRSAGHRVLHQPASRVIVGQRAHAGGPSDASHAADRERFAERRATTPAMHPTSGCSARAGAPDGRQRRILVIDETTPRPDRDSASLRQVNLLRMLTDAGAHVAFLPTDLAHAADATRALQSLGVEAWYAPFADSASGWLKRHAARFDVIVLSRHHVAGVYLPLLRRLAPQARLVLDSVDLHYLRERRGAQLAGDAAAIRAADTTRERELAAMSAADLTLVVSEDERAQLAVDAPALPVEVISNLHEVAGAGAAFDARHDLVFVGGFRHPPNVDAVLWFGREIFPRIRAVLPGVRFHCIGAEPPDAVRALAGVPGIVIHGHVPDLHPYMDGMRIAVAPLRFGAGVKGKINLSMAHGQPVVATACAVEGMHLRDGVDVRVADDPADFADAVVDLYHDRARWELQAANGLDNVQRHFSLEAARAVVERVFLDDVRTARA